MTYEISRYPTDETVSTDNIVRHLSTRTHYSIEESQVWYRNEETGVYFFFTFGDAVGVDPEEGEGEAAEDRRQRVGVFVLNYFRPHVFALEAEPEGSAFVEALGLRVEDPQVGGMGHGAYSSEGFLDGWTHGNYLAYRSLLARAGGVNTVPSPRPTRSRLAGDGTEAVRSLNGASAPRSLCRR